MVWETEWIGTGTPQSNRAEKFAKGEPFTVHLDDPVKIGDVLHFKAHNCAWTVLREVLPTAKGIAAGNPYRYVLEECPPELQATEDAVNEMLQGLEQFEVLK